MTENEYNDFSKKMKAEYPKMFSQPFGGFAVGKGWWPILESLCSNIQSHVNWKREQRANDLVFNRALKRAISVNSIDPLVEQYQRRCKREPSNWTLSDFQVALEEQNFREVSKPVNHVIVHQIKEKFGGLRFYYEGGDEQVFGMVRMAEAWASRTCEQCGEPGTLRPGGWVQTLCDKHEEERQAKMKERYGDDAA